MDMTTSKKTNYTKKPQSYDKQIHQQFFLVVFFTDRYFDPLWLVWPCVRCHAGVVLSTLQSLVQHTAITHLLLWQNSFGPASQSLFPRYGHHRQGHSKVGRMVAGVLQQCRGHCLHCLLWDPTVPCATAAPVNSLLFCSGTSWWQGYVKENVFNTMWFGDLAAWLRL